MEAPASPGVNLPPEHGASDTAAISHAIVRLLRQSTGRGPTRVVTVISPELAVVTLTDCLTRPEKTLAEHGRGDVADGVRAALFDSIRAEAVATVEAVTGSTVAAYLAAQEYDPDVAVLAFYFGAQ